MILSKSIRTLAALAGAAACFTAGPALAWTFSYVDLANAQAAVDDAMYNYSAYDAYGLRSAAEDFYHNRYCTGDTQQIIECNDWFWDLRVSTLAAIDAEEGNLYQATVDANSWLLYVQADCCNP